MNSLCEEENGIMLSVWMLIRLIVEFHRRFEKGNR